MQMRTSAIQDASVPSKLQRDHLYIYFEHVEKIWREIFANLIQPLTSGARVLNSKACRFQVRSPGGSCGGQAPYKNEELKKYTQFFSDFVVYGHFCGGGGEGVMVCITLVRKNLKYEN